MFDTSTFTWECPELTATATPRPTATNTPRPTATDTPRPTPRPRPTARPATATPTPTPASRGWLTASQTTIDVGGSTTVSASWEPAGLAPWLGFASDSTAVLGRSSRCSGTRFVEPPSEATLRVYGCQGGSGTVELRAGSITGRLLDSITITVRTPPTPTPTVTPSGELSADKTSIGVGETVTVSAVNVSPSGQSVYIVTNGRLGFARPGTCHFEINPRSSGRSAKSWTLEGCSPPGSGSVTLKTSHNGQTLVLDSITIDVSPPPTPTNTPTTGPTVGPTVGPTAEPTDTPSPTPTLPTGWITAAPAKIPVGQTTTITATWSNVASTPKLRFGPQLAENCPGTLAPGTPDTELTAKASQVLTGCADAIVPVQLLDGNTILDTVEVTVLPLPKITASRRMGYRYFQIDFSAHSGYKSLVVEWRNKGQGVPNSMFSPLPTSVTMPLVARGIINRLSNGADIRGLEHLEGRAVEVRVVGTTAGGLRAEGTGYSVLRNTQPPAIGHLPDHYMMYDVTALKADGSDLATWLHNAATSAASTWANVVLSLKSCRGTVATISTTCPLNTDQSVVKLVLGKCDSGSPACYRPTPGSIERKLEGEAEVVFNPNHTGVVWTNDKSEDQDIVDGRRIRWVPGTLVHEFGHAFGLDDRYLGGPNYDINYNGIMKKIPKGDKSIKANDRAALIAIYETHIEGQGW